MALDNGLNFPRAHGYGHLCDGCAVSRHHLYAWPEWCKARCYSRVNKLGDS
ncbi:hypothetical protein SAMN05660479_01416 [Microbulbifer thermotolerans]|nr:hypothetical protein SAMN05660479_01416 [Microbulbifer thermotolerans]